ncbi:MAG TPA: WG repeat-containing protein [bacterium]|nr:WG repeat-containing protein [bacterium]
MFVFKQLCFVALSASLLLSLSCKQQKTPLVDVGAPYYMARYGNQYLLLDAHGKEIPGLSLWAIGETYDGMTPIAKSKDGGWFFINDNGMLISESTPFIAGNMFTSGLAAVKTVESKYGFIDKTGKWVIPPEYDDAGFFDGEIAPVKKGEKWGYVDIRNKIVIDFQYDLAFGFNGFLAQAMIGDKHQVIDKTGKVLFSSNKYYDLVVLSSELMGLQRFPSEWILLSKEKVIAGPERSYYKVGKFHDGLSAVMRFKKNKGYWGFIDTKGNEKIPLKYNYATDFSDGIAAVEKEGLWNFISLEGKALASEKLKKVDQQTQQGVWIVEDINGDKGLWSLAKGFSDMEYDEVGPFISGQTIRVRKKGLYGLIDTAGKEILPAQYEEINQCKDDSHFLIKNKGLWGYGDALGDIIITPRYENACCFIDDRALVVEDKDGPLFVDLTGKTIFKLTKKYSMIWRVNGKQLCDDPIRFL